MNRRQLGVPYVSRPFLIEQQRRQKKLQRKKRTIIKAKSKQVSENLPKESIPKQQKLESQSRDPSNSKKRIWTCRSSAILAPYQQSPPPKSKKILVTKSRRTLSAVDNLDNFILNMSPIAQSTPIFASDNNIFHAGDVSFSSIMNKL